MSIIRLFEVRANGDVLHLAGREQVTELISLLAQSLHDTPTVDDQPAAKSWSVRSESEPVPMECRSQLVTRRPKRVRLLKSVQSDLPAVVTGGKRLRIAAGVEVEAGVNRYGAVWAILADNQKLGLKPGEFEVIEWDREIVSQ